MSNRLALSLLALWSCAVEKPPVAPPAPAPPPRAVAVVAIPNPVVTPDAPFRAAPPVPSGSIAWTPPHIESWTMPNGVRVLLVERHDLPVVAVRVVSRVGAGDMPGAAPGVVAFTGAMLEQGAGVRDALKLSDDYEALGADHASWCDWDACVVRAKVLASRFVPAMDLLADVVLRPSLQDVEIERSRKRWLGSLQQEKSSPPTIEQNALAAALYGRAQPYGHSLRGVPGDIRELKRSEIQRTWRRAFQPHSTTLVVAGDVTADTLRTSIAARFGSWHNVAPEPVVSSGTGASSAAGQPPAATGKVKVVLVDVPGAAQSQVFVAQPGVPFRTADRIALGVMNAILGGMFSSRINLDLREAHAYTYGARSRFSMRHGAGPFAAGGAIFAEHTVDAARALLAQVERIVGAAPTAEELADAKENARLALPARFEGVDDSAAALQDLAVYDLPLDEYQTRSARIDAVTAEEVQRVAKAWLHPESMTIVVTGDRSKVEGGLSSLGPVELRDAYGDPVKP